MKILIAGGYSYLGANIAEKFLKERHEVTITGMLKKGDKGTVKGHHKFYNIKADSKEYQKIFEANNFDAVLFISASLIRNYSAEDGDNIKSLKSVLESAATTRVKKFVLLSSTQIYGNSDGLALDEQSRLNPFTSAGIDDQVREFYTIKTSELGVMSILLLRISDIYGPYAVLRPERNNPDADASGLKEYNLSDTAFDIVSGVIENTDIVLPVLPEDCGDFIYIDDAVEGIYRTVIDRKCTGILNISTAIKTNVSDFLKLTAKFRKIKKVTYVQGKKEKVFGPKKSWISNSALIKMTGWTPTVSLKEGIKKTIEIQSSSLEKIKKQQKAKKKPLQSAEEAGSKKTARNKVLTVAENIILFLFFAFLQWGSTFFKVRIPNPGIDFLIIYILIVAVLWGQLQSYLAMILASILYISISFYTGMDIVTFIYVPENLIRLAIYLIVGIISGYSIESKNRDIEARENSYSALTGKYMFLLNIYNQTRTVKTELENQIIDTEDSFSNIYNIIQEVNSLEIESVYAGAVSALERIMKTDKVSIFIVNGGEEINYIRLKARSLALADKIPNSFKLSDFPQISKVIETLNIYVNKNFEPSLPVMIAPVTDGKKVIAIISIHDTEFENLTRHYENLFQTVVSLIADAIKRAYYFAESLKNKRYIGTTKILKKATFEKILAEFRKHKESMDMSYSLLSVNINGAKLKDISAKITSFIRENDYIGFGNDGKMYVLLSNTKNSYADIVIDRLRSKAIISELVKEEVVHE